jgi:transcriptional regulator with XRE-family HTH domain
VGRGSEAEKAQGPDPIHREAWGELPMSSKTPDKIDMEVGRRIRMERLARGLTQTELADHLGLTFQQVQKYEKGVNRVGAGRLAKIADILGITAGRLLGADEKDGSGSESSSTQESPVKLLNFPGAPQLLRAYVRIPDRDLRRVVVALVEKMAGGSGKPGKRRSRS